MRVDSAAVLCSAALCNLAEVPQCRPGLVSSGALKMIKSWLEIGNDVLAQARVLCFNQLTSPRSHSASSYTSPNVTSSTAGSVPGEFQPHHSNSPLEESNQQHIREQCYAFMEAFGPAYELISNAAAALMHLSGTPFFSLFFSFVLLCVVLFPCVLCETRHTCVHFLNYSYKQPY